MFKHQRLSNDPEINVVLRAIDKFAKSRRSRKGNSFLKSLCTRSGIFFEVEGKARQEIEAAKLVWKAHFDLLSDIDELNQCKRAMRLRANGEDLSGLNENEAAFIVDANTINADIMEHEMKQASAMSVLRRTKDSLRYLKNQRLQRTAAESSSPNQCLGENRSCKNTSSSRTTPETCAVCLAALDAERSVLPCGHCFHHTCVDLLFKRSGTTIHCPMRCPVSIKREDILIASNKSKEDGSRTTTQVLGSWGTKVNHLVGDVLDMVGIGDKGIIFSQWDELLEICGAALHANHVAYIRPRSGKRFGEDIKQYRSSNGIPILLMNVKNGAEGLTITEANHVFLVEPILNCGLDMQAISRIDRIGQTSKTFVHRYIVKNTVEEKFDRIRMERQENHFEDDLQEQKKHSIKGGGIDGGFDESELRQLFE